MARFGRAFPPTVLFEKAGVSNYTITLKVTSATALSLFKSKLANLLVTSATSNLLTAIKLKGLATLSVVSATTDTLSTHKGAGMILSAASTTTNTISRAIKKVVGYGDTPTLQTYSNTIIADSPSQYWRFQELGGNSNVAYDSISQFFMTFAGGVTKGVGGTVASPDFGLLFDGSTGSAAAGIPTGMFQNSDFSVEFWMLPVSLGTQQFVYAVGVINSASTDNFLHIGMRPNQALTFAFFGDDFNAVGTIN